MSVRGLLADLIRGIREDIACCEQMRPQLVEQQRQIVALETEALNETSLLIAARVDDLRRRGNERSRLLREIGLAPGKAGMEVLIGRLPDPLNQQMAALWLELEKALARCKALNERNGELLAAQKLAIGQLTGQEESVYRP